MAVSFVLEQTPFAMGQAAQDEAAPTAEPRSGTETATLLNLPAQ
ncbi:hypothetical protein OG194_22020 [Streptomyces sp. NBC_01288]|nr:hypothetical protein OG194_22020 [Streptomyces sp. NBC_01288]